jgi:hypothetical protein
MPPERLPWQTYFYHRVGRRDIGRPRRRYRDNNSFSLGTGQRTQFLNGKKKKTLLEAVTENIVKLKFHKLVNILCVLISFSLTLNI